MTVVINASINLRGNPEADRALLDAAEKGNIEAVKWHLDAGADVNAQDNDIRWTPLHVAAAFGHKEIVELLIAKGADVNAKSKRGTPLSNAVKSGDKEIVEWWVGQIQSPLSSQIDLLQSTRRRA
ncbi:MAG TPA: ankyrin repeat domain-containing protein [Gammaproteobacteria bacterium]|nr:ankyrin repeat domain-containing protein [Gammaproteobacteria bacterium]